MLAVELVPLDVRENPMGESDHLIVGLPLLLRAEEVPIVLDKLPELRLELLDGRLEGLSRLDPGNVAREASEGHGQVIVPGAVVMVEAVPDVDVEPGITRGREFLEPFPPGGSPRPERRHDRLRRASFLELSVDAELHRPAGEAAQFLIGTEDLRLDPRPHARDGLVADLREGLLTEG